MKIGLFTVAIIFLAFNALAIPLTPGGTTAWFTDGDSMWLHCPDGRIHLYSATSDTWDLDRVPQMPVPDEEVLEWYGAFFLRSDGTIWAYDNAAGVGWHELTSYPCAAPVVTKGIPLGSVKSLFR